MAGSRVSFSQPSNLSIVLLLLVNGKVFFSNREIDNGETCWSFKQNFSAFREINLQQRFLS